MDGPRSIVKNVRENVPGIAAQTLWSVSQICTFVDVTRTSTAVGPPGQDSVDAGGRSVSEPVTFPFVPLGNVPLAVTRPVSACFFGSLGKFPPPFWQA